MKKEYLKEIIYGQKDRLAYQADNITRGINPEIIKHLNTPPAIIVKGVRRCGKSTLLNQLLNQKYADQYYYLNFEDERLLNFKVTDFNALYELFVELLGERKIFYFDEVQNIEQWELFVRRMQDSGFKFFITGSNASLLSREMGTRLTGRHLDIELFPFSFREFLKFHHWQASPQDYFDAKTRGTLRNFYNQYLQYGGMPEYLRYQQDSLLVSTYEDILFRDIISRHEIKDIKALRELALYLMTNAARPFSYNHLKNTLSLGSVTTVKNYIQYLEDSYLIFTINQFSYSLKQQISNNKKVFVIDNGLANAIAFQFSKNKGQFLENLIFLELKRRGKEVYFYKTKNNLEVDFLIRHGRQAKTLIQVAHDINHDKTRQREIKALVTAMEELDINSGFLITDDSKEDLKINHKTITIIPAYQWLLENE